MLSHQPQGTSFLQILERKIKEEYKHMPLRQLLVNDNNLFIGLMVVEGCVQYQNVL